MHHQNARSEGHDCPHYMLYQQYGQAAAAVKVFSSNHSVGLGGAQSRHNPIEQSSFDLWRARVPVQALAVWQRKSEARCCAV
jgi:hypothetical protein